MKLTKLFVLSIFVLTFLTLTMYTTNNQVFASSQNNFSYEDYLKGIEDGWIDDSVTYEMLIENINISNELEDMLSNSEEFEKFIIEPYDTRFYNIRPGDILITNATSKEGITGHAAIALDNNQILHIQGPGHTPVVWGQLQFISAYMHGWIYVYRPTDAITGQNAANWASRTYRNSNARYVITTNLSSTDVTYCSKLVWQSYYFGAGRLSVFNQSTNRLVLPYNLPTSEIRNLNYFVNIGSSS